MMKITLIANHARGASDRIRASILLDGKDSGDFVSLMRKSSHGVSELWSGYFRGRRVEGSQSEIRKKISDILDETVWVVSIRRNPCETESFDSVKEALTWIEDHYTENYGFMKAADYEVWSERNWMLWNNEEVDFEEASHARTIRFSPAHIDYERVSAVGLFV